MSILKPKLRRNKYQPALKGLVWILILFFFFCGSYLYIKAPRPLEFDFFDVGQGDSALIKVPNGQLILIDGGPDNTILRRLGEALPFYRRRIDLMIFSHYHDDHIVGLIEVLKRYRVGRIIYAPSHFSSPALKALQQTAGEKHIALSAVAATARLDLAPACILNLLNPLSLGVKDDPNNSLVVKLACANQSFLFSGDNSAVVEKALLSSAWNLSAAILKISHHGSNSASSEAFLRAVQPRLAFISVGADNKFGHPSPLILERLRRLNIKFWRSDQNASLRVRLP